MGKPVSCVSAVQRAESSLDHMRLIRNPSPLLQELARYFYVESVVSVVGRKRVTEVEDSVRQKRILLENQMHDIVQE